MNMYLFRKAPQSTRRGATITEYAIMLMLICIVGMAIVFAVGYRVATTFDSSQQAMPEMSPWEPDRGKGVGKGAGQGGANGNGTHP